MRSARVGSLSLALAAVVATPAAAVEAPNVRPLDGSGNNLEHRDWGKASTPYIRVTKPYYANGVGQPHAGPAARYVSNRVFNDTAQNLFSENGISHWGFTWGLHPLSWSTTDDEAPGPFSTSGWETCRDHGYHAQ